VVGIRQGKQAERPARRAEASPLAVGLRRAGSASLHTRVEVITTTAIDRAVLIDNPPPGLDVA
jgi:hypothetical protein